MQPLQFYDGGRFCRWLPPLQDSPASSLNVPRCFREDNAVRISSRSAHKWMDGEVAMILSSSVVFVRCEEGSNE